MTIPVECPILTLARSSGACQTSLLARPPCLPDLLACQTSLHARPPCLPDLIPCQTSLLAKPPCLPDFQGESNHSQAKRSEAKWARYLSGALVRPRRLPDFQGESNPSRAKRSKAKRSRYLTGLTDHSSRMPHNSACQIKRRLPDLIACQTFWVIPIPPKPSEARQSGHDT